MSSPSLIFSPAAQAHLDSIEDYLAGRFYPGNARHFVDRLVAFCNSIAAAPGLGKRQPHLGPGVRSIGFEGKASIYFRTSSEQIVILGISYRGRRPTLNL